MLRYLFLLLFLIGCDQPASNPPTFPGAPPPGRKVIYSHPEQKSSALPKPNAKLEPGLSDLDAVRGMSESGVLAIMGTPDQKYLRQASTSWLYNRAVQGRRQKGYPELILADNQVVGVNLYSKAEMKALMSEVRKNKGVEPEVQNRVATFTFDEATRMVMVGSSKKDILNLWGEPDIKLLVIDRETWRYETLIVENGAQKVLDVTFEDDIVIEISEL